MRQLEPREWMRAVGERSIGAALHGRFKGRFKGCFTEPNNAWAVKHVWVVPPAEWMFLK